MTRIDVGGDEAASGLVALVVAVVEVLVDALEREAIRRMESGALTDEEIERLGSHLAALEEEVDRIKREEGVEDDVGKLRDDLDALVEDALRATEGVRRPGYRAVEDPSGPTGGPDHPERPDRGGGGRG